MAVHFILLIILPITYIACEKALNYQLRFLIRYEFLFRIPNAKISRIPESRLPYIGRYILST